MNVADGVIFAGFASTLMFVVVVLSRMALRKPQSGTVEMVLVGAAAGPNEAHLWSSALQSAGIKCRVVNVGDVPNQMISVYSYEVWVRARDEHRARKVLGM